MPVEPERPLVTAPDATFEVLDHFYITGRGALAWGQSVTGRIAAGMLAESPVTGERLRVTGFGSLHHERERQHSHNLLFRAAPLPPPHHSYELLFREISLEQLRAAFPAGSVVRLFKE